MKLLTDSVSASLNNSRTSGSRCTSQDQNASRPVAALDRRRIVGGAFEPGLGFCPKLCDGRTLVFRQVFQQPPLPQQIVCRRFFENNAAANPDRLPIVRVAVERSHQRAAGTGDIFHGKRRDMTSSPRAFRQRLLDGLVMTGSARPARRPIAHLLRQRDDHRIEGPFRQALRTVVDAAGPFPNVDRPCRTRCRDRPAPWPHPTHRSTEAWCSTRNALPSPHIRSRKTYSTPLARQAEPRYGGTAAQSICITKPSGCDRPPRGHTNPRNGRASKKLSAARSYRGGMCWRNTMDCRPAAANALETSADGRADGGTTGDAATGAGRFGLAPYRRRRFDRRRLFGAPCQIAPAQPRHQRAEGDRARLRSSECKSVRAFSARCRTTRRPHTSRPAEPRKSVPNTLSMVAPVAATVSARGLFQIHENISGEQK